MSDEETLVNLITHEVSKVFATYGPEPKFVSSVNVKDVVSFVITLTYMNIIQKNNKQAIRELTRI